MDINKEAQKGYANLNNSKSGAKANGNKSSYCLHVITFNIMNAVLWQTASYSCTESVLIVSLGVCTGSALHVYFLGP